MSFWIILNVDEMELIIYFFLKCKQKTSQKNSQKYNQLNFEVLFGTVHSVWLTRLWILEIFQSEQEHADSPSDTGSQQSEVNLQDDDESQSLNNVALFIDFQETREPSWSYLLFKLKEKLVTLTNARNVINIMKSEDLFRACNKQTI